MFDTSQRVPGVLSYLGRNVPDLEFSFDEVVEGIQSLDGDERCGLTFQRGSPLLGAQDGRVIISNWHRSDMQPTVLTGDAFCVGGGESGGYICYVYTEKGEVWLNTCRGEVDDLHEIYYDCGCDIEQGVFPGTFVVSYDEVVDAARHFFFTGKLIDKFPWISRDNMDFDPWYRD